MSARTEWQAPREEVARLLDGAHHDPHAVLGIHTTADGEAVVRTHRPDATSVAVVTADGADFPAERTDDRGFFEARVPRLFEPTEYWLRVTYPADGSYHLRDPYAFWPTLGEIDLHLAGEGRHEELWRRLGAHVVEVSEQEGVAFAVWAPNARSVRVVGDFNGWDGRLHPMRSLGSSGVWELFVPELGPGTRYKFEMVTAEGELALRADPYAFHTEPPPGSASVVFRSSYEWGDEDWLRTRPERDHVHEPMSVYEVHLGSWLVPDRDDVDRPNYRDLAHRLAEHVERLGFTHVEFLPVAEHPYAPSWGYQVTGQFAPTARFGDPDDFRYLVDHLHQRGIGVIVDWVPAHFPKDAWALARFDGTALYEHADPRQAEHPDWGTLVFNYGRNEVRNYLLASALYWIEELHVDGLRVDAVASMLYLDYSREEGEWVPNEYGGNENLDAIEFLKQLNAVVYGRNPGVVTIAEESTAWPGVSRPVHMDGLGFGFKWNMGWMHDTLSYFSRDPIHRQHHHNELTFGLLYAWSENYVLPLSHDEVVHGKRSLLDKMPGDRWQKFANMRALFAHMWAHPGKQLLFMGGEFGQWREWSEEHGLDWYLRDEADHAGLERLVADLNTLCRSHPQLYERDAEPEGFAWIEADAADENVIAYARYAADGSPLVCAANLTPVPRHGRTLGMPQAGVWREALNTDASSYGGSDVGNAGKVEARPEAYGVFPAAADIVLPPLGVVWLVPEAPAE